MRNTKIANGRNDSRTVPHRQFLHGRPPLDEHRRESPYNGSLPFVVELDVFCTVVDDEFVVTVRNGLDVAAQVSNVTTFPKEQVICQAVQTVLGVDMPDELPELTSELANYGYRYITKERGAVRAGGTQTVMLLADNISELDAALKLDSDPEFIYDLLGLGAALNRRHVRFGQRSRWPDCGRTCAMTLKT